MTVRNSRHAERSLCARGLSRRRRAEVEALERRELLSGVEPTAEEQYMLQLINRARSNPPAEAQRLLEVARTEPAVAAMTASWNLSAFESRLVDRPSLPPLAFNTRLIEAARDQNQSMLALNDQRHSPAGYLTDVRVARADDGQAYLSVGNAAWAVGENIFAYSRNLGGSTLRETVDYFHAGFMIDWGNPDFVHLENVMAPGPGSAAAGVQAHRPFQEVGIGLLTDAQPTAPPPQNPAIPANRGLNVGPTLVTQEFGWRSGSAYLTGAIYQDRDNDQFYTPGEGLGGVRIQAVSRQGAGSFEATTWGSGGYSLPLSPGTYTVTASGGALLQPRQTVVSIGQDNLSWDVLEPLFTSLAAEAVPADYDGDGRTDQAVFHPDAGIWVLPLISSSSPGGQTALVRWGLSGDVPVPADYDGDSRADVAVFRPSNGRWYILPRGGGPPVFDLRWGLPGDIPVPGDYDGDARSDLAVFRPSNGRWYLLPSGSGQPIHGLWWGLPGDVPVPADYDGDKRTDLAVFRPSEGRWYILPSKSGQPIHGLWWGLPGDVPVPADYDGDGRVDPAVFRPTDNRWYVLSHAIAGALGGISLGQRGDQVAPGDYNKDGMTEIAVYRPGGQKWISQSLSRQPAAGTPSAAQSEQGTRTSQIPSKAGRLGPSGRLRKPSRFWRR